MLTFSYTQFALLHLQVQFYQNQTGTTEKLACYGMGMM